LQTIPRITGAREARLKVIEGQPPILMAPLTACPFRARCEYRHSACDATNPARRAVDSAPVGQGHDVACHWRAPARAEMANA
jgi:oligopeptide transport system ATP-binding protein